MIDNASTSTSSVRQNTLTRDHIIWVYRILLNREPESEEVIQEKLRTWRTTDNVLTDFLTSPEFRSSHPDMAYINDSNVVIKEMGNHLRLYVDLADYAIGLNIVRDDYAKMEQAFVLNSVQPGQIVLDIGANIGFFAITMAALVGPTGHVYAFEPIPTNADLLARSIAENKFAERMTLEHAAVGAVAGEIQMVVPEPGYSLNSGGAYIFMDGMELPDTHSLHTVPMLRIDNYMMQHPVSFIKIDVEGAEPLVLRGAENLLQTDRPVILSELHGLQTQKVSGCTPTDFIAEMHERGYDCYMLGDGQPEELITAADDYDVSSVVFVPQSDTAIVRDIQQRKTIERLQQSMAEQQAYIYELEQRSNWLNEQSQALQRNLQAVEQGRVLRVLRWLHTLRRVFTSRQVGE